MVKGIVALVLWWPAVSCVSWSAGALQWWSSGVPSPSIGHDTLAQLVDAPIDAWWWLTACSAVVIAPILEELLYRGFMQQALRRAGAGPWVSIAIVASLFSAMHLASVPIESRASTIAALTVLGLMFGWLAERTGTLVASIAAHAAFNMANLVVAVAVH